jgi:next-to-BRCA1 protein 1
MARFVKEFFASPSVPIDSENQPQPGMLIAQPGEPFTWFWRFRNDGPVAWPCQNGGGSFFEGESNPFNLVGGVQLVPVGRWADHANFQSPAGGLALPMSSVAPGEVVDVALPLRAPALPGLYRAYWRLATHSGKKFGPRVQVNVLVVANRAEAAAALGGDFALQRSGPAHLDRSSDDDEDSSSSSDDEKGGQVDFVAHLQQLNDMGFGNQKKNMKLLLKHNGDLEAVVACLLKKKDKKAMKQAKKQHC